MIALHFTPETQTADRIELTSIPQADVYHLYQKSIRFIRIENVLISLLQILKSTILFIYTYNCWVCNSSGVPLDMSGFPLSIWLVS